MKKTATGKVVLIDGQVHQRQPDGSLVPVQGQTDWVGFDDLTDADVEAAAEADPDAASMSEAAWARAQVMKPGKGSITIRIDQDILDHFRAQPGPYQSRINAVLRQVMERERARD